MRRLNTMILGPLVELWSLVPPRARDILLCCGTFGAVGLAMLSSQVLVIGAWMAVAAVLVSL